MQAIDTYLNEREHARLDGAVLADNFQQPNGRILSSERMF
jgi:hypothetical protein